MQESEITADLTKESFDKYIKKFTDELGKPKLYRRVSFMVLQRGNPLDNRIKITNGKARIVQKLKAPPSTSGHRINEEVEIDIPDNLESVRNAIQLFTNFYKVYDIENLALIVQHENYVWNGDGFELKIARQFGKQDLYLYEIETTSDKSPEEIQRQLGIQADYDAFSLERQKLRRENIDIPLSDLTENEMNELIMQYLEYTN